MRPFNGTTTTYTSFDSLGRPGTSKQTTLGQSYTFPYAYNLAGSITAETLPSLPVINTAYDALNQSTSVSSGGKTYASNVAYWPHGAVYSYQRYNGLSYGVTYNSRLQLTEVDQAVPATPTNTFLWVSCPNGGLNNGSNAPYGVCPSLTRSSQNNGNLQAVTAYAPNNNAPNTPAAFSALQGIQQTFAYDGLNRITSITDNGGGSSASRTFGYDAYGNMWIPTNTGFAGKIQTLTLFLCTSLPQHRRIGLSLTCHTPRAAAQRGTPGTTKRLLCVFSAEAGLQFQVPVAAS